MKTSPRNLAALLPLLLGGTALLAQEEPADGKIPDAAKPLIDEAVAAAAPPLLVALELANAGSDSDKNFAVLATKLKGFGFGEPPASPPRTRAGGGEERRSGGDGESAERRKEESAARMKRVGQADIRYLQGVDANSDLKTDKKEIEAAIGGYLAFQVQDKLSVDGNGDHRLSLQEYALSVPAKGEPDEDGVDWHQRGHFERDDTNGDGYLDLDEIMGHDIEGIVTRARRVRLMFLLPDSDTDGDGFLSEEEFAAISGEARKIWEKASPEGDPVEIARAYPDLFWLDGEELAALLPKQ